MLSKNIRSVIACIKTQNQLHQFLSVMCKKQSCNYAHFRIKLSNNEVRLNMTIERLYESKAVSFDSGRITDVKVLPLTTYRRLSSMVEVENFTYDYALLKLEGVLVSEYGSYFDKPIIVVKTKKNKNSNEDWIRVFSVGSNGYVDWENNAVTVNSLPAGDKYKYMPMLSTDGEEKKDEVKFRLVSINGKMQDDREAIFNASTNGAFNILKQNYVLGIYSKLDLNKFRPKLSKGFTPSKSIGIVRSMAIYQGYFSSNSQEGYLCREVIKAYEKAALTGKMDSLYEELKNASNKALEDEQPIDGVMYVNLNSMKDWLEEFLGCTVLSSALYGWMAQLRPATVKALGKILKDSNYKFIVRNQVEECKYRRALLSQAAKIARDNGDDALYTKLVKLADAERIVVTDGRAPELSDCFTDQNGQKLPFDFGSLIEMHYIASKKADTHFNMGTQTWNLVFEAARLQGKLDEAFKLFEDCLSLESNDKLNNLLACKNSIMTPEEFSGGMESRYYNNILRVYAPIAGTNVRAILRSNVTDLNNAYGQMFTKCRVELKGFNAYLTFDDYFMFCKAGMRNRGIIPEGRFYCGRTGVNDILGFKSPINSSREYFKGKAITYKEVKALVDQDVVDGIISPEGAAAYLEELKYTPETAIVLPALSIYKHLLAGADEDGDTIAIMVFTDDNKEDMALTRQEVLTNEIFVMLAKSNALAVVIDRD